MGVSAHSRHSRSRGTLSSDNSKITGACATNTSSSAVGPNSLLHRCPSLCDRSRFPQQWWPRTIQAQAPRNLEPFFVRAVFQLSDDLRSSVSISLCQDRQRNAVHADVQLGAAQRCTRAVAGCQWGSPHRSIHWLSYGRAFRMAAGLGAHQHSHLTFETYPQTRRNNDIDLQPRPSNSIARASTI